MNKRIITALIGTGNSAEKYLNCLKKNKNFDLKYILSNDDKRGKDFSIKNNCELISKIDVLKGEKKIDLIIITTNPSDRKLAIDFANKKINMIIEKPLSLNSNESELIFKTCKKNNIICGAGLNRHYDTYLPIAKNFMKNIVGDCYYADYKEFHKGFESDYTFTLDNVKKNGDVIISGLVHRFDQANYLFGNPHSLFSKKIKSTKDNVINHVNVSVTYKNIFYNINCKIDCDYEFGEIFTLYCEKGIIEINFQLQTISAISNPLHTNLSFAVLSRYKDYLIKHRQPFKFEKNKIIKSYNFKPGKISDILNCFVKKFNNQENVDLVDINDNFLTTKMAFASYESIKSNKWLVL